jgi:Ser/Thr protein kinase RdoA (MazF antagonist)
MRKEMAFDEGKDQFQALTPDSVLNMVEDVLDVRCNNLFRPMNSYINRVFEVESLDKVRFIAKFYRPGRWSKRAILDEHKFLLELAEQELPVIAPLPLKNKSTLAENGELYFAIFPKCGGRSADEFSDDQWLELGRLIGRMHAIGAAGTAENRLVMSPEKSTLDQLKYLMNCQCVPDDIKPSLEKAIGAIIREIAPFFKQSESIRIHGDCHFSNVIHRPGESLFLIDFDDMAMGPPVQDVWMLLPGGLEDCFVELDLFLEGYETFRPFDKRSLQLLEPLRAMRFVHYMAWCAHQVEEDGLTRVIDGFGTREYWQKEIGDLLDQRERIADFVNPFGNVL